MPAINIVLARAAWDPYPFILLNLFLSMLAAIQAPVIMMSQNRQDTKDRLRGELDYDVNRRAESEIQGLARKLNLLGEKMEDVEELLRQTFGQSEQRLCKCSLSGHDHFVTESPRGDHQEQSADDEQERGRRSTDA